MFLFICKYKQIATVGSHLKLTLTSTQTSRVNASTRLVCSIELKANHLEF